MQPNASPEPAAHDFNHLSSNKDALGTTTEDISQN